MKYIIIALLFFNTTFSQNTTSSKIYNTSDVEVKPTFVNGEKALQKFIVQNFNLPSGKSLKGEVLVTFVVEVNGSLTEIGVLQDVGHGTGDEAIRVMGISPNWIPGKKNGIAVRTQYLLTIPINTFTSKKKKKK
jgi:hypothetical protein